MRSRSSSLRRAQPLLGTLVEIAAEGPATRLPDAVTAAFAAVARIGRLMSFHDPASELSELNRAAHRAAVGVSDDTAAVLDAALTIASLSGGAFDPCVAPALVRLGYLPGRGDARPARGWAAIRLLPGPRVRFDRPLTLDLGGIAKGYAVDRACAALEAAGIFDYVVNAGGDIRVGCRARRVHVRDPADPQRLVPLGDFANAAVATSASYFAARESADGSIHPIVAPDTGRPARYSGSISVRARACVIADALTKVVAVLGRRAAPVLARAGARSLHLSDSGRWSEFGARAA